MRTEQISGPRTHAESAEFVHEHQSALWRYLRLLGADRDVADDLMQEAFLRVLDGDARLEFGYLRRVARNLFLDRMRHERRREARIAWTSSVEECVAQAPQSLDDDFTAALRTCLDQLRGRARRAVRMRHAEGRSQADIADQLGLRLDGVKALLRRSRVALRACIEREREVLGRQAPGGRP